MYKIEDGILVISSRKDLDEYCKDKHITRYEFNEPVRIADGTEDCSHMFENCSKLNQKIVMPDSVIYCEYMFANCKDFNQPVEISKNAQLCCKMFLNCESLNQDVNISNSVYDCSWMFKGCKHLDKTVTIPDSVENCYGMFYKCENLRTQPHISEHFYNSSAERTGMFYKCDRLVFDVSEMPDIETAQAEHILLEMFGDDEYNLRYKQILADYKSNLKSQAKLNSVKSNEKTVVSNDVKISELNKDYDFGADI